MKNKILKEEISEIVWEAVGAKAGATNEAVDKLLKLTESKLKQREAEVLVRLKNKYAPLHEEFCAKGGKQFKKCLACVMEEELQSLKQNTK